MKSATAQIPCYIMAYSAVFTDAFLTTQYTGHTDAATTLLTFRLQTTTEHTAIQYIQLKTTHCISWGHCYNFRIQCCIAQTLSLHGAWAIEITAEHTGYTDLSVTAEHTGCVDLGGRRIIKKKKNFSVTAEHTGNTYFSVTAEHTGYTDLSVTAEHTGY
jgi:hypothetical protein